MLSAHHITMDGWCNSLLFGDLMENYKRLEEGIARKDLVEKISRDMEKVASYSAYIKWIEEQDKEEELEYWELLLREYNLVADIKSFHIEKESDKD